MVKSVKKEVEAKVSNLKVRFLEELNLQIRNRIIHPEVVEHLATLVISKVSVLGGFFSGVSDDKTDPTLERYTSVIRAEVERNLVLAQATVTVGNTVDFTITLLSDEFLGIDTGGPASSTDSTEMRWLFFFVMGDLEDNLYWVPAASLNLKGVPGLTSSHLGRFGTGLLIQSSSEEVAKKNKRLSDLGAPLVKKHPQSGASGQPDLFQSILSEALLKSLIVDPALSLASQAALRL
ncbi:MAG: hypothetical protein DRQ40_02005 [Gammaproteobacteria bacterium]|nr:MAG: hypothetical protein DRQ40_02005 [Gammaproteobacteria bacterium]